MSYGGSMAYISGFLELTTEVQFPPQLFTSCVSLDKLLNSLCLTGYYQKLYIVASYPLPRNENLLHSSVPNSLPLRGKDMLIWEGLDLDNPSYFASLLGWRKHFLSFPNRKGQGLCGSDW